MKKIAIFGSGGFGREVHMLIEQINKKNKKWEFIGYFDDRLKKGAEINGYLVLGGRDELNKYQEEIGLVITIGDPKMKEAILDDLSNDKIFYPILIHPNVLIGDEKYLSIGEGTIICAGSIITVNVTIGKHVIINLDCTVGHDADLEELCSLMPSVNISGNVVLKKGVYVGTGAQIVNQLNIGKYTIIGAGSVVANDLPSNCTAVGIPAKPIKFHDDG